MAMTNSMAFSPTWQEEEDSEMINGENQTNSRTNDDGGVARLVSYLDDDDDDESANGSDRLEGMEDKSDISVHEPEEILVEQGIEPVIVEIKQNIENRNSPLSDSNKTRVELPPEPEGNCPMELQETVEKTLKRMEHDLSFDLNRAIQDNKNFRNPSIYEKLISFLGIDEKGTNYPKNRFDPYKYPPSSFYDELSKAQQKEMDRIEKLKKEQTQKRTESGIVGGGALSHSSSDSKILVSADNISQGAAAAGFLGPKKRSKWDNSPSSNQIESSSNEPKTIIPATGALIKTKNKNILLN